MKYLISILILFILIPGSAHKTSAQGNTISFEHFSQENGLSNNIVQCCYQDLRGYLWFGTSQGLNRFDGYKFTQFLYAPEDSTSLYGNLVRVIFETREGQLLIGTENGGLNLFNRDKELFSNVLTRFHDPRLRTRSVNDVEEDQSGRLWVATDDGLLLLPDNLSSREVVRFGTEAVSGSAQAFIRVIVFDTSGHLWMGTNAGVYVLDTLKKEAVKFDLPVGDPDHNEIWELTLDAEGRIWVG
ncbi:MAG TPA: two-component regulator propeller domain-containing protein, partial [Prolixibacteraceae bacterium]|nr:two-component regulator propeller domain-containing protein [Prolixibacteraceae bacterium]